MAEKKSTPYLTLPALKVNQPLGAFYAVSISARDLLSLSFSEPLKYIDDTGAVRGSQRIKTEKRLKEIAKYIESVEMAFPNSIILAANYSPNGSISTDENERWRVESENDNSYKIIIPQNIALAAIIDGQHRLNAFEYVNDVDRIDNLQLLCSIYFDLPNSYQAFLFATINSNQKKVDRSLALEQFGYNVDDEPEKSWTPEKLAVFLSRKLNIDKSSSPFYQHIKVAALNAEVLFPDGNNVNWAVSTATVVDGITSLISSNVKRDRVLMQQTNIFSGRNRSMLKEIVDISPLRKQFIELKDQTIYDTIVAYFNAFSDIFWKNFEKSSYIFKTVGVQASFDILKMILVVEDTQEPASINFYNYLNKAARVNFADKFYQASGIGRSRIRNTIGIASGLVSLNKVRSDDRRYYDAIISGDNSDSIILISPWYENAEANVIAILERTNWNYKNNTVAIDVNEDFQDIITFTNFEDFYKKLIDVAENSFVDALPDDPDFVEQQRQDFDSKSLVDSVLASYEHNLKALGWNK